MSSSIISMRVWVVIALGMAMGVYMAMGCGSSGSATSSPAATGADGTTLASVPSVDVSTYDPSTGSSSSSSESVLPGKSLKAGQGGGNGTGARQPANKNDLRPLEGPSRAGCEQNIHKREIIRNSQTAQLDRCYIQSFADAGIITIPTDGTRSAYLFKPPAEDASDRAKKCEGMPDERAAEKEACLTGGEGPTGGVVAARVGVIDGELQIDVCSGRSEATLTLENESTYTGGTAPTFNAVRIGRWQGNDERNTISGTVSGDFTISDGDVTLGDTGTVNVAARMNGGPGSGAVTFVANPLNYTLSGGFNGAFTDPFSGSRSTFTGVVHATVGKESATDTSISGSAKFSYTGSPPAMPLKDMMPFDLSGTNRENFIKMLAAEMGISVTAATLNDVYVCPNKNFDPKSPSVSIKPMVAVAMGATCDSVTHTGVESFELANATERGNFATKRTQTFKRIANTASPFFDAVNAKDLSTVETSAGTIAFSRNWDCTGITGTLDMSDPSSMPAELASKLDALQSGMEKCSKVEENLRDNEGMGGHNCGGRELTGAVDNMRNDQPSLGNAGGEYVRGTAIESSCSNPEQGRIAPERFFINLISDDDKKYCFPSSGGCTELVVDASTEADLDLAFSSSLKITQIAYGAGTGVTTKATTALVTFRVVSPMGAFNCSDNYTITQPSFDKPAAPPPADQFPAKCKAMGITEPDQCADVCRKPESRCFES